MKKIGITGGVGSGKSQVLAYIQQHYDAAVCQADEVARHLQHPGEVCYNKIIQTFGEGILNEDSTINRERLADIVFSQKEKRKQINKIVHPAVKEYILKQINYQETKQRTYFIIEAALLIEDNYDKLCDELWYIYAPQVIRKERLQSFRGYSLEKVEAIFGSQLSEEQYRKHCLVVIRNDKTFADTIRQINIHMNA